MGSDLVNKTEKDFESIKHTDENGVEFWYARELMKTLEYSKWGNFKNVINKAKEACKGSDIKEEEHFADVGRVLKVGNNAEMKVDDLKLTRYACYLIAQNGDSRKKAIALAQTYFAVQTRKQEITRQEYEQKFNNYGYRGLYNGETSKDIATRKGISDKEDILDYMSSTELAANLFRITQTDEVLKNKNINNEDDACITHHKVGQAVRQTIKKIGGTMPEDLPTPTKSAKQIEKEKNKKLTFKI